MKIVDDLLYSDIDEVLVEIHKLNSQELVHAYVTSFNWDDDIDPILVIIEKPVCSIVTAKEMFDLADVTYWLKKQCVNAEFEQKYVDLIRKIFERYPQIKEFQ